MKLRSLLTAGIMSALFLVSSLALGASLSNLHRADDHLPAKVSANTSANQNTRALKSVGGIYPYSTQISVSNRSSYMIYVNITGSPYYRDPVLPGKAALYYSDDYFDYLYVRLYDVYGTLFYQGYVQNYSNLDVYNNYFLGAAPTKAQAAGKPIVKATVSNS